MTTCCTQCVALEGERVDFCFIGGNTEAFVLNSLGVQLLKQSMCPGNGVR